MKKWGGIMPVVLLWLDMVYGFGLNLFNSLALNGGDLPKDGLPVAPDIAFSGLQLVANGGMIVIISWGFWTLWQLHRGVVQQQIKPIGIMCSLGIITVLAFSLPAWWHWLWAIADLLQGQLVVAWHNPRYLAVALLMPYPAALCLWCLYRRQRQKSQPNTMAA